MNARRFAACLVFLLLYFLLFNVLTVVTAEAQATQQTQAASGRELFEQYKNSVGVVSNTRWDATIEKVVNKLSAVSEPVNEHYEIAVLDISDSFNAFALTGGYIAVYSGVLELFDAWLKEQNIRSGSADYQSSFESLLAGVLSHEMAHVLLGHHSKAEEFRRRFADDSLVIERRALERDQELEADRIGSLLMVRAGYPLDAMYLILKVADAVDTDPHSLESLTYFRTHPRASDREANLDSWKGELKRNQARVDDAVALIQNNLALDMAIALLDSALVYFPSLISLRHNRASAWHRVWLNSLPVGPNTPQTAFALYAPDIMEMLRSEGDQTAFRNAVADYEAVLSAYSAPQTRSQLAALMASAGGWEEAGTLGDQALTESPTDPVVLANASAILLYGSKPEVAGTYAQEAMKLLEEGQPGVNNSVAAAALYNYGLAAAALGADEEAREAFALYASRIDSTSRFSKMAISHVGQVPKAVKPFAPADRQDLTVAGVQLGDSQTVIEQELGPAEQTARAYDGLMLEYPSHGVSFLLINDICALIMADGSFPEAIAGIRLGAGEDLAERALGQPQFSSDSGWRGYASHGVAVRFTSGRVDRILLSG